tara:strand:- start:1136 stop:1351 length:216 start_codon:yes stop_codon:yes gene_type:complete
MNETLIQSYKELVTQYQDNNRRNAVKVGKALGRVSNLVLTLRHTTDITEDQRKVLLKDLDYIYENIDEIEL